MPDTVPPWLATMRKIDNTQWAPGQGMNPTILEWLRAISSAYPNMANYCSSVMQMDYFEWCGLTVAYCMAEAKVAPVFGSTDTSRFLWAAAWMGWGTSVSTPQQGDVVIFDWGGGHHHVTLFDHDNGDGTWSCHGGNQTHKVQLTNFPKKNVMGVRRPSTVSAVQVEPVPATVPPASQRFAACVALVLHDEGGNDDDPRDPGGRTSRGITQAEWDRWRQTHPDLPSDVWQAPQDQIVEIYHKKYWNVLQCDGLPAGVDYVVFDYGVNSGNGRAAKVLQGFVGAAVDGEIGPQTLAATSRANASKLINQISDERLAFLRTLSTWPTFGHGWQNRVERVRNASLAMVSASQQPVGGIVPRSPGDGPLSLLKQVIGTLEVMMPAATPSPQPVPATPPQPAPGTPPGQMDLSALIQQGIAFFQAIEAAKKQPDGQTPNQQQVVLNFVMQLLAKATGQSVTGGQGDPAKPPLGQVNGALGQTIGNLLNGNKSAIGIIGALVTAILQVVGPSIPLDKIIPLLAGGTAVPGLGSIILPIFLAIGAWGVLGKFEKWLQPGGAPAPTQPPAPTK